MASPRPWESEYTIRDTTVVAETDDLRVLEITLDPGEAVPWHYHGQVTDTFYCLEGALRVETRAPRAVHALAGGGQCAVPARTAHHVSNDGDGVCRFVLVQGPGAYDFVAVGAGT